MSQCTDPDDIVQGSLTSPRDQYHTHRTFAANDYHEYESSALLCPPTRALNTNVQVYFFFSFSFRESGQEKDT